MKRDELLALLAEAGAELVTQADAHNVPRELFDRFPGDEHAYGGPRPFWSKGGTLGVKLNWRVFTGEPPVEP